eukprot:1082263-Pyramimonas_sp.AAC.1
MAWSKHSRARISHPAREVGQAHERECTSGQEIVVPGADGGDAIEPDTNDIPEPATPLPFPESGDLS